jgi:micrococcal nuclease
MRLAVPDGDVRRGRLAAGLAVALVVLSGCAGVALDGAADAEPTAAAPDVADGTTATVVDVVDGDTVDVRYADGSTDTVRLLGVDTPEVYADTDPAEYEGVPDTAAGAACLEAAAEDASAFAERWLAGARVTLATDPAADRRDRYDRLLAYVHVDASATPATAGAAAARTDFTYRLVATGHARVYDGTFSRSDRYYAAEAAAQDAGRGVWQCRDPDAATVGADESGASGVLTAAPGGLALVTVRADAPGNDNENLGEEFLVFRNDGTAALALGGWTVGDAAGHTYRFPSGFELAPGETVTLRTGRGEDSDGSRYWGRRGAVWNNGGDTVVVARDGETVLRYSYD